MPRIIPITDLRKTNEISEMCHQSKEPVFITKNGYGDLVALLFAVFPLPSPVLPLTSTAR